MTTIDLCTRLAGSAWGHLVGDAVGVPFEFRSSGDIGEVHFGATGTHRQPPGTWSDDGALMLALLDSLLEAGFDPEDQGRRALAWAREGAYTPDGDGRFDVGCTTSAALRALEAGTPAIEAGPAHEHASSNGSLMRILPVGLVGHDLAPEALIEQAHLASRVTHGHPRCQVACAVYCLVVRALLHGDEPQLALDGALEDTRRAYADSAACAAHLAALDELEGWTDRDGSGFVLDAFWSAWDAFAGAEDYADAIRRAVEYGNDTDTTAAIAGGLAGARWGWAAIPLAWRRGMRDRAQVTRLVDRLVARAAAELPHPVRAETSTASPLRVDLLDLVGVPGLEGTPGSRAPSRARPGSRARPAASASPSSPARSARATRASTGATSTSTSRGSASSAWTRCSSTSRTTSSTGASCRSCRRSWRARGRS